ncbi:ABC transporter ATP-binding protein [Spelaeicoccus albus]|uniref:Peptide/nickel transport system ATP-binding protein n=1 Tax=Spelaeicoccus albus TaxID=1280376 RepID=A0A7Z0D591_9MICO|nr:ABC transporter ATP-binding protein [Spelaeicoccus albus]NYI69083.1 peptide/nickel transport system ATP-binding protein [Spelaeicoccus albus]
MTTTITDRPGDGTAASPPAISVRDLSVDYASEHGEVHAVRGLSFDVEAGRTLAIAGESGSGKSATSLAAMGLLPDSASVAGSVRIGGREIVGMTDEQMTPIRGSEMSMIFQDPLSALTPVFTIGQQIAEALDAHQTLSRAAVRSRSIELLELVGISEPERRLTAYPHQFSGGMRQRVMIAIAIANDPQVIIADEPTTALDVTIQAQVLDVLATAQRETGAAVVLITHDLGVVAGVADDVLIMYAGRPVEYGTADQIFTRPQMPYTMGLLGAVPRPDRRSPGPLVPIDGSPPSPLELPPGCPFAPRCPMATQACEAAEPPLVLQDGGHMSACIRSAEIVHGGLTHADVYPLPTIETSELAARPRAERDSVLSVDGLHRHFNLTNGLLRKKTGTVRAVDGISFDIRTGETLALVGESGCGKSTTLLEIMRLKKPGSGRVVVMGRDVAAMDGAARRATRKELQIVFQDPISSLDPRMVVYDVLAEPLRAHGVGKARINDRIGELMQLVGLNPDHVDRFPEQFSGGQRQRIAIARALAVQPALIVLDEPVSALDVSIQAGIVNLLESLQAELKLSYLFVAHDLSVVRHIADRVAVMYLGRIVEIGGVDEIFGRPRHPYTQALLSAAPIPDPAVERARERTVLTGDLPSPTESIPGCRFRTRCPTYRLLPDADRHRCETDEPELVREEGVADQERACHFPS